MDLSLNRKSQLPTHVQLKAQLAHLIQAGQLAPGVRFPRCANWPALCGLIVTQSRRSLLNWSARVTSPASLGGECLCPGHRERQRH